VGEGIREVAAMGYAAAGSRSSAPIQVEIIDLYMGDVRILNNVIGDRKQR